MKKVIVSIGCILVFYISQAQQGKQPILVTDMLRIKEADNVVISPDGQSVVFAVKSIVPDADKKDDYQYNTQLWLVSLNGNNATQQLTAGTENAGQPVFSPDSKTIVFTRNVKGKSQLFQKSLQADTAVQLTHFRYGASNPRFSPDGKRLVFTTSVSLTAYVGDSLLNAAGKLPEWNDEKPGFSHNEDLIVNSAKPDADGDIRAIRAYLAKNEKDKKAKVITRVQFQGESATTGELNFSHVFIMDAVPGATPKPVTSGFSSFRNPQFISNTQLAITVKSDSTRHPDDVMEERVYTIYSDGSLLQKIAGEKGVAYSVAAVSPSGKWLAYQRGIPGTVHVPVLYLLNLSQPGSKAIPVPLDRNIGGVKFTSDDSRLYFTAQTHGGEVLYTTATARIQPVAVTAPEKGIADFDVRGNQLVYVQTDVSNPSEVYLADAMARNSKLISALNTGWLQHKLLSYPQRYAFKNNKGLEVEYWVMKPAVFDSSRQYPLLLEMHGGPAAMWGPGMAAMWHEYQYYCAKGIGVVYSNPRGSSGYGETFLQANVNDWGEGPASDVLAALDKTVAQGWVDTSRLLISGGSYAGYLTCWIISHDNRFRAASSQRGVYSFPVFFGEANVWRMVPRYFGGYPWDSATRVVLEKQSPINYVNNINTPYLIFHGESDLRTGVTQSEMLYKSLKVLGKPVEYVRHPGASHELVRSGDNRQRIDQLLRTYEFFDRYLR